MKRIVSSLLAGAVILSGISCAASSVNIKIDGELFVPKNALGEVVEPFIENGSTYLPVRAMGDAVGKQVAFDAENYAVYIGKEPSEEDKRRDPFAIIGNNVYYQDEMYHISENFGDGLEGGVVVEKLIQIGDEYGREKLEPLLEEFKNYIDGGSGKDMEKIVYALCVMNYLSDEATDAIKTETYAVTARHILVDEEEAAKEIIERLNGGADFGELMAEYELKEGCLEAAEYTFAENYMVKEFEEAAFNLEIGAYTKDAVKTIYGYHVIERLPLGNEVLAINEYIKKVVSEREEPSVTMVVPENYGSIENVMYTKDDLYALGGSSYNDTFQQLKTMTACAVAGKNEGLIEEESYNFFKQAYEEDFAVKNIVMDEEKKAHVIDIMASYTALMYDTEDSAAEELVAKADEVYVSMDVNVTTPIKVFVDGKLIVPVDVQGRYVEPENVSGSVFVPVRAICEALGMDADWDGATNTVMITK